jgi:hypothetical protein
MTTNERGANEVRVLSVDEIDAVNGGVLIDGAGALAGAATTAVGLWALPYYYVAVGAIAAANW